jgi:hypothetical protein
MWLCVYHRINLYVPIAFALVLIHGSCSLHWSQNGGSRKSLSKDILPWCGAGFQVPRYLLRAEEKQMYDFCVSEVSEGKKGGQGKESQSLEHTWVHQGWRFGLNPNVVMGKENLRTWPRPVTDFSRRGSLYTWRRGPIPQSTLHKLNSPFFLLPTHIVQTGQIASKCLSLKNKWIFAPSPMTAWRRTIILSVYHLSLSHLDLAKTYRLPNRGQREEKITCKLSRPVPYPSHCIP